jgi:hypothetical protein
MVTTFDGVEDAYSASGGRFDRSSARTLGQSISLVTASTETEIRWVEEK